MVIPATFVALPLGKIPRYPLNVKLGDSHNRYGPLQERNERFLFPSWNEQRLLFQINEPTGCSNFPSLLLDVYVQLNKSRASSCPSSGAQQLQQ
jgi:hypothetical protein